MKASESAPIRRAGELWFRPLGLNPYPLWNENGEGFSADYLEWERGFSDGVRERLDK